MFALSALVLAVLSGVLLDVQAKQDCASAEKVFKTTYPLATKNTTYEFLPGQARLDVNVPEDVCSPKGSLGAILGYTTVRACDFAGKAPKVTLYSLYKGVVRRQGSTKGYATATVVAQCVRA